MEINKEVLEEKDEAPVQKATSVHISTPSGFECDIERDAMQDAEMYDDLSAIEEGDFPKLNRVIERLLGAEQKSALFEHCRNKQGRVLYTDLSRELMDIFNGVKELKNS